MTTSSFAKNVDETLSKISHNHWLLKRIVEKHEYRNDEFPAIFCMIRLDNEQRQMYYRHFGLLSGKIKINKWLPSISAMKQLFDAWIPPFELYNKSLQTLRRTITMDHELIQYIINRCDSIKLVQVFLAYHNWYQQKRITISKVIAQYCNHTVPTELLPIISNYIFPNRVYSYFIRNDTIKNLLKYRCQLVPFVRQCHAEPTTLHQYLIYYIEYKVPDLETRLQQFVQIFLKTPGSFCIDNFCPIKYGIIEYFRSVLLNDANVDPEYKHTFSKILCNIPELHQLCESNSSLRDKIINDISNVDRSRPKARVVTHLSNCVLFIIHLAIKLQWNEMNRKWEKIIRDINFILDLLNVIDVDRHQWYPWYKDPMLYFMEEDNKTFGYGQEMVDLMKYLQDIKTTDWFKDCHISSTSWVRLKSMLDKM